MLMETVWNEKTLKTLRKLWPKMTSGDIADIIGCSDTCVRDKARKLGLKRDPLFRFQFTGRYTNKGRFRVR